MGKSFNLNNVGVTHQGKTDKKDPLKGLGPINKKEQKQSLINPSLEDIQTRRGPKIKKVPKLKKVNTKVPQKLLNGFMMYCISEGKFQKEVYPEMVRFLLDKYKDKPFEIKHEVNGVLIDFENESEQVTTTLEILNESDNNQHQEIMFLKARNASSKLKLKDIYGQAILQFLHEKQFKVTL